MGTRHAKFHPNCNTNSKSKGEGPQSLQRVKLVIYYTSLVNIILLSSTAYMHRPTFRRNFVNTAFWYKENSKMIILTKISNSNPFHALYFSSMIMI